MAYRPTQGTDSAKPGGPDPGKPENFAIHSARHNDQLSPEIQTTDFAKLAAKFVAHGAGKIPAELSGELALDLVLNEIVDQACLATGAAAAAIALRRNDAIVCRATTGTNAPELGTRLDTKSGLSGACVRSGTIQSCDDAWSDSRADGDLSRQLGVRSVVVYPLVRDGEVLGIFEILSPLPSAFGPGDLQTLEGLARRIIKNADAAKEISLVPAVTAPAKTQKIEDAEDGNERGKLSVAIPSQMGAAEIEGRKNALLAGPAEYVIKIPRHGRFDWLAATLSAILVAIALVMSAGLGMRMGWIKVSDHGGAHRASAAANPMAPSAIAKPEGARDTNIITESAASGETKLASSSAMSGEKQEATRAPEGTLFVYQEGKEILRVPPPSASGPGSRLELVSRVEPEYPELALEQHIQGAVGLNVRVSADGKVQQVKVESGNPLLATAAVTAVRQWRFKPYVLNGQPREIETTIKLDFTLPPD